MWLLTFLPDFVFHLIILVSVLGLVAGIFFGFIPFVNEYALPIKVGSIILLVIGMWFEGGISNNNSWLEKVHALEKKVAESEVKSAEANTKLVSEIAEKNKQIAKAQSDLKNRIKESANSIDSQCKIPSVAINILNDAAIGLNGSKK